MQRKSGGRGTGGNMSTTATQPRDRHVMLQSGSYGLQFNQLQPPSLMSLHHQQQQQHQQSHQHHQQQQQQQQQAYLSSGMSIGNLGMTMTMSDMASSIRGFAPAQLQHPAQVDSSPAPFWRPTSLLDSQQAQQHQQQQYKQPNASGLDLEFNDFLNSARDTSVAVGHSHGSSVAENATSGDMNEMASSFQLSPAFASHPASSSSVAPLSMAPGDGMQNHPRHIGQGPSSSASTSPTSDASSTQSTSAATSAVGSTVARPAVPVASTVAATTGTTDASDYSRFVDSTDEPDLSQQKIEQKNEKCQYHNCPNRARVSQAYGKFCNRHVIVAPCGFPGCRDKALLHSSMCDKHLAEGKDSLHRILANRAQNVPVCRTFGCFKNDQGRGYCRGHEKLLMATGRLPKHINKRRLNSAYTMCSFPNCNKHSQRNHLCRTHGNMILKQADELVKQSTTGETFDDVLARLQKEIRRCTHPTCTKNSQRDRLCTVHYYEKYNTAREGGSASMRDQDGHLSSTDGGGESEGEPGMCNVDACSLPVHSSRGLCKYHSGQITPENPVTAASSGQVQSAPAVRSHPPCSIPGCCNESPFASGLCSHHNNKTNQAIQITRMGLLSPPTTSAGSTGSLVCSVASCMAKAVPNEATCEHHVNQRRAYSGGPDSSAGRPALADGAAYQSHIVGGVQFGAVSSTSPDANGGLLDRFGSSSGTTGRMASLSVGTGAAENDARQALVTLNNTNKQFGGVGASSTNDSRGGMYMASAGIACSNPICSRESYGREFCEACHQIFSPLVVSVGDSSNGGNDSGGSTYPFPSLTGNRSHMLQSEPEGDTMWDSTVEAKPIATTTESKPRDSCRAKGCSSAVTRGGLCDNHFRSFQTGSLSVDEITLRSRQIREEKERARAAAAAAAAAAEMKHMTSPKLKKYFCKTDGCEKQAQKKGLCKRHFRMNEDGTDVTSAKLGARSMQSSFKEGDNQFETTMELEHQLQQRQPRQYQQDCRYPGCGESVTNASPTLCSSHSNVTFCWQAGCENLVASPQFCEYHSYRRDCGFEGCSFPANRDASSCSTHAMERHCSHEYCAQFALPRSDRCRVHMDDCAQHPCRLCAVHGLQERGAMFHPGSGGNNNNYNNTAFDVVDDRELTRQAVFGDGRVM